MASALALRRQRQFGRLDPFRFHATSVPLVFSAADRKARG